MPMVEIDTSSLTLHHSWLADAHRMDFNVVFWTNDLKNVAIQSLENLYSGADKEKQQTNQNLVFAGHRPRVNSEKEKKRLTVNQIQVKLFVFLSLYSRL